MTLTAFSESKRPPPLRHTAIHGLASAGVPICHGCLSTAYMQEEPWTTTEAEERGSRR